MRRNNVPLAVVLFLLPAVTAGAESSGETLSITYLANEGFHIHDGKNAVLIDALFRAGVSGYATIEPQSLERLESAAPPFDTVRLVLVTHVHADHFDPRSAARHLASNPGATFVSSEQVAGPLRAAATAGIKEQIRVVDPEGTDAVDVAYGGITVRAVKLSHGLGPMADIANFGFIVQIAGQRLLHIGDADVNTQSTEPLARHAVGVDVACVPYWWLLSRTGRAFIQDELKPRNVIAMHAEPEKAGEIADEIHRHMPEVRLFARPGEMARY
jgi:L-ascorbate metabolism protein UlaG (beta-lactamase superfamily)